MRKLIGIEFLKMTHSAAVWLVGLLSMGQGIFYGLSHTYDAAIARFPQAEYIVFIRVSARWFCMAAVFLTAYTIAGDFAMRTILNVFSAGIHKTKYYFSRLAALMIFFFCLYLGGNLTYLITRILSTGKVNTSLPAGEFVLLVLVMSMQVIAYVAVANLIGVCCRKQAPAVILGEILLFLSLVLRIYSMGEEYYTNPGAAYRLKGPVVYEPLYVLESVEYYLSSLDSLFCPDFLQYALGAALIMLSAGMAGYVSMMHALPDLT